MPRDLYADTPAAVPAPVAPVQPKQSGLMGFLGGVLVSTAVAFLACLLLFKGCDTTPADDDVDPPTPSVSGLHVLIVEETADRETLPSKQVAIFTSATLRDWYEANCAKVDGHPAYRCFDKDDKLDRENPVWQELKSKLTYPPPAYIVVNGKYLEQGKLSPDPATWQATLEKAKKGK